MKHKTKRALTLGLAAAQLASMSGYTVFAEGETPITAGGEITTDGSYIISNDLTLSTPITVKKGVTATITVADGVTVTAGSNVKAIINDGTLTLNGSGTIDQGTAGSYAVWNRGTLNIEGSLTITGSNYNGGHPVSTVCNGSGNGSDPVTAGTINFSGGTISHTGGAAAVKVEDFVVNGSVSTFNMTGGKIISASSNPDGTVILPSPGDIGQGGEYIHNAVLCYGDVNISGGEVIGILWADGYNGCEHNGQITISGTAAVKGVLYCGTNGAANTSKDLQKITVSGGTFVGTVATVADNGNGAPGTIELNGGNITISSYKDAAGAAAPNITLGSGVTVDLPDGADPADVELPEGKYWKEDAVNGGYTIEDVEEITQIPSIVELTADELMSGSDVPWFELSDESIPYDDITAEWTKKNDTTLVDTFDAAGEYTAKVTLLASYGSKFTANTDVSAITDAGWTKGDIAADGSTIVFTKDFTVAASPAKGTVTLITTGISTAAATDEGIVFDADNPITGTLTYSKADTSIGRNSDGYWIGLKITVPNGVDLTADTAKMRKCSLFSGGTENWTAAYSCKSVKDSDTEIQLWGSLTEQFIKYADVKGSLTYKWEFDWNGDGTYEQSVDMVFDTDTVSGTSFFNGTLAAPAADQNHSHDFTWTAPDCEPADHDRTCVVCGYAEDAISEIAFDDPALEADKAFPSVTVAANDEYELDAADGIVWKESGSAVTTAKAESGKNYTAEVKINAKDGYLFKVGASGYETVILPDGWTLANDEADAAEEGSMTIAKKFTIEEMPAAEIDFEAETLTGLEANGEYLINGSAVTAEADGTTAIGTDMFGTAVSIVKAGDAASGSIESGAQKLDIPERPTVTGVTAENESVEGSSDGKLKGLIAGMQYKPSTSGTWTDYTGSDGIVSDLAAGTYNVRVKATTTSFASEPAEVEIAVGDEKTYTLSVADTAFDGVKEGYAQPEAKALTISNSGNSDATVAGVEVSGEAFEIVESGDKTVPAGGRNEKWAVRPKAGLAAGDYAGTVTVTYDGGKTAEAKVSFSVAAKSVTLTAAAPTFDSVKEGYAQPDAKALTISNSGTDAAEITSVAVSGTAFEIVESGDKTVPAGGRNEKWAVRPKAGLAAGDYSETVTVTYNGSRTTAADVLFTVAKADKVLIDGAVITVADADNIVYDGKAKEPVVSAALKDGTKLTADDFDVKYSDNVNAGTASVTITAKGKYAGTASAEFTIKKADQTAPAAPALSARSSGSITLKPIAPAPSGAAAEYSIDNGKTWQDSNVFKGLSRGKSYTFIARYKAVDNYNASDVSEEAKLCTSSGTSGGGGGGSSRPSNYTKPSDSSKPTTADGKTVGWPDIANKISGAAKNSEFSIELNGDTTVPAAVLAAAAKNDLKLSLKVDNTYTWTIDGANISGTISAASFAISAGNVPAAALSAPAIKVCDAAKPLAFTAVPFAYKPSLSVYLGTTYAGKFANLYKLNGSGALEFAGVTKVNSVGTAVISADSNGTYVIAIDDETKMPGDIDNSMTVTSLDAAALLKEIISKLTTGEYKADYNGDGKVNSADAATILRHIVGLE